MNKQDRADSWVKSRLQLYGKPLLIIESRKGVYLGVVDRNSGGFETFLANTKSRRVESFKRYESKEKPIQVLMSEVKNRNLRIVVRTE